MIVTRRSGEHGGVNDKSVSLGSNPVQLVPCTQSGMSLSAHFHGNQSKEEKNE